MQFGEACRILQISENASMPEIKQSYRKLVRRWHPDKNGGEPEAARNFQLVQSAYEYIEMIYAEQQKYMQQAQRQQSGTNATVMRLPLVLPKKGEDVQVNVELSFLDAFNGSQRTITFQDFQPCDHCGGTGNQPGAVMIPCPYCPEHGACDYCDGREQISDEPCVACKGTGAGEQKWSVRVSIPRSVKDGEELKSEGKGQWGLDGRGDLYVKIRVMPHPQLERKGDDLWVEIPVNILQSVFGGTVWIPGLEGTDYQIEIPPNTSSGVRLKISGKGFWREDGYRGDIYAVVMITVPQTLNERQRYFYEQLLELEEGHF